MRSLRGLGRRLARIESRLISDSSQLIPHSERWWAYWDDLAPRIIRREVTDMKIPLEYFDAVMAKARAEREQAEREGRVIEKPPRRGWEDEDDNPIPPSLR